MSVPADVSVEAKMRRVHWVPLESNPDVLNAFASKVGMPDGWGFTDIFGTDPELLMMLPPTCVAVTLLFACTENSAKAKAEQRESIEKDGQKVDPGVVYMKQFVGNACGTIACIHSMMNNAEAMGLQPESAVGKFMLSIKGKTPEEAGACLADATDLHSASEGAAAGGQTEAPEATAATDCHFITFVEKGGDVYELDGGKAFPINHGAADGRFLEKACTAIKANFIDKDPESIQFNMMALVKFE